MLTLLTLLTWLVLLNQLNQMIVVRIWYSHAGGHFWLYTHQECQTSFQDQWWRWQARERLGGAGGYTPGQPCSWYFGNTSGNGGIGNSNAYTIVLMEVNIICLSLLDGGDGVFGRYKRHTAMALGTFCSLKLGALGGNPAPSASLDANGGLGGGGIPAGSFLQW